MDIIQIVVLGIVASILYIILKDVNASFAFILIVITGIIIFLAVIKQIGAIFQLIETLGEKANIDGIYMETILKIIGIAYIAEIGASLTKDAGLGRSEEHTSELQSRGHLVCRLLLEKKKDLEDPPATAVRRRRPRRRRLVATRRHTPSSPERGLTYALTGCTECLAKSARPPAETEWR